MRAIAVKSETPASYDWAPRCAYWATDARPIGPRRRGPPVILCGHGLSISIDKGALLIRDGLTHYPQERMERRIFPGEPTRPQRIVVLDGSGSLSLAALDWLRAQDIALIRLDWTGAATVIGGASGYAADPQAWRRQEALRADPSRRMLIARSLIVEKLARSTETLNACITDSPRRALALAVTAEKSRMLRRLKAPALSDLHGVEGRAAKVYFDAWAGTPIAWKSAKRRPIPDAWQAIGQRQSFATGKKGKNYAATHPQNAMLNYAYAVLESHVRLEVIAAGFDPLAGFLHQSRRSAPALVFDLMEPLRPVADSAVLQFVQAETFSAADFTLRSDGVVRLSPQLARRVALLVAEAVRVAPSPLSILQSGAQPLSSNSSRG